MVAGSWGWRCRGWSSGARRGSWRAGSPLSLAMLVVRRWYVRRLFPERRVRWMGLRGALPVLAGTGATLALRLLVDPGTVPELLTFAAVTFGAIWVADRPLMGELVRYLRRPSEIRSVAPEASSTPPASPASQAG